ncbi:MAG: hypothetical protein U0514_03810 [Candidatus Andersenbacteria bacterium]
MTIREYLRIKHAPTTAIGNDLFNLCGMVFCIAFATAGLTVSLMGRLAADPVPYYGVWMLSVAGLVLAGMLFWDSLSRIVNKTYLSGVSLSELERQHPHVGSLSAPPAADNIAPDLCGCGFDMQCYPHCGNCGGKSSSFTDEGFSARYGYSALEYQKQNCASNHPNLGGFLKLIAAAKLRPRHQFCWFCGSRLLFE